MILGSVDSHDVPDMLHEEAPKGYIMGLGRDCPVPKRSHLYKGNFEDPGRPMCRYGWNRKEYGYSIWRGNLGDLGICKICMARATESLPSVENPYEKSAE